MLLLENRFMMDLGVRNAMYLNNPNIIAHTRFHLPQRTIIHYLDLSIDSKFPNRNHYYFNGLEDSKRARVYNVVDHTRKEGVASLLNKTIRADIQNWKNTHKKGFKVEDILEEPITDNHNVSVVNYNLLKGQYKYMSSILSEYNRVYNVLQTYADTVKQFVDADRGKLHLVSFKLPLVIPGYNVMRRLMNFDVRKLSRTIEEVELYWLFELYKWLVDSTRNDSVFKNITDKDSERILVEFKFRGYGVYVKLSTIRGLSSSSQLESIRKFDNDKKLLKFFLTFLNTIQEEITELSVQGQLDNLLPDDSDPEDYVSDEDQAEAARAVKDSEAGVIKPIEATEVIDELVELKKNKVSEALSKGEEISDDDIFEDPSRFMRDLFEELDTYDDVGEDILEENISGLVKTKKSKKPKGDKEEVVEETETEEVDEIVEMDDFEEPLELMESELKKLLEENDPDEIIDQYVEEGKSTSTLSAADIRKIRRDQEVRKRLKDPYTDRPIDKVSATELEEVKLEGENIEIPIDNPLIPDNLKSDKTTNFDKLYIEKYLRDDLVSVVKDLEKSGTIITDYTVEEVKTSVDRYEIHRLNLNILGHGSGPVYFRLPIIDDEGTFMVGGRKYRYRKSKQDLPIRKISEVRVALTSNYGKFFVDRTKRKAYDTDTYILDYMRKDYLNESKVVTKIIPGKKRMNLRFGLPNTYFKMASEFDKVITKDYTFLFAEEDIKSTVKENILLEISKGGRTFLGYDNKDQTLISIDHDNEVYNESKKESLGNIVDLLGIDWNKLPRQFSSMVVMGREIPLAVTMSYYLGLTNLIRLTNTKYRIIPANKRLPSLDKHQLALRFSDYRLILDTDTIEKQLIFNGFLYYRDFIKNYKLSMFDKRDIFLPMVEFRNAGLYHLRELDMLRDMFLDSITIDVLEEIKEPTSFIPLILRANEMLADYGYPDINDPTYSRIRGYDRIAGLTYRVLSEAIRENKIYNSGNKRVSLDPYKVWNTITQDSSHQSREAINPVSYIKEDETVTLTGTDGLNSQAVPVEMRRYHKKDAGLFTESTSDSKDVAIASNLSPYAKIENLRGLVQDNFDEMEENPAKFFSTAVQVSPLSEIDDPKRINFTGIQNSHMVPSTGYQQSRLRTGYEYMIPYKTGKDFALMAFEDGEVTEKTPDRLTVKYKSGRVESYKIGSVDTFHEGVTYKNVLISNLGVGDKFKEGDNLYYHKDFFEPDWLDPKRLIYKQNKLYTVAIMSNEETYEDSSAISSRVMKEMRVTVLKERVRILEFDTNIDNIVKVGDKVTPNTPLFVDTGDTDNASNLSEQTLSLLESISSIAPRAKYNGVVDRIEIKYNGDKEDMSPSLRRLANRLDKELYERTKGTTYEAKDNKVSGEYSSGGNKLNIDTMEIKFFIAVELEMGVGDKQVIANQAKSVIGKVYNYPIVSAVTRRPIDVQVALVTFIYRVTSSSLAMGIANRLLDDFGKKLADEYFSK